MSIIFIIKCFVSRGKGYPFGYYNFHDLINILFRRNKKVFSAAVVDIVTKNIPNLVEAGKRK